MDEWMERRLCSTNTQHTNSFFSVFFFFIKPGYRVVTLYINKPLNIHSNRSHRITLATSEAQNSKLQNYFRLHILSPLQGKKRGGETVRSDRPAVRAGVVSMSSERRQRRYIWLNRATGDGESENKSRQRRTDWTGIERETAAHWNKDRKHEEDEIATSRGARFIILIW